MLIPFCLILSILWTYAPVALSSPIASPNPAPLPALTENLTGGNGYTGSGGNAVGGNVLASKNSKAGLLGLLTGDKPLLSAFSGNAGNGGDASTGNALAGGVLRGGRVRGGYSSGLGLPAGNGRTAFPVPISGINLDQVTTNTNVGNAYTGAGGNAAGGTVSAAAGLIDLFSHNAGDGGKAKSGAGRILRRKYMNKNRLETHDHDAFDEESRTPPPRTPLKLRRLSRSFRVNLQ